MFIHVQSVLHMSVVTWHCQTIQNEVPFVHISKYNKTCILSQLLIEYVYGRIINETGILSTNFDIYILVILNWYIL